MDTDFVTCIAQEVDQICTPFLRPRGFYYFQFKRVYKNGSLVILANHPDFFKDFLKPDFTEFFQKIPFQARQSAIYSLDELQQQTNATPIINGNKVFYHGITFVSRRKPFYDCTTFAMSEHHPTPCSCYFNMLKELQNFVELFPTLARGLIEKARKTLKILTPTQDIRRKKFFLPKRSSRLHIGTGKKDYVTTYEVLCLQLLQEGKSYKEIGSVLSMSKNTVETHLTRLKARTGLTFQELSLKYFHGDDISEH